MDIRPLGLLGIRNPELTRPGPLRTYVIATFVNRVGTGLLLPVEILYFTQVLGLSSSTVAIGLTLAGLAGMSAPVHVGRLADRIGSRRLVITVLALEGVATAGYVVAREPWSFVLCAVFVHTLDIASRVSSGGLVATAFGPEERVRVRAVERVVINVAIAVGALGAAGVLMVDDPVAYRVLIACDAATFVVSALVMTRVPRPTQQAVSQSAGVTIGRAIRDRPYVAVTALLAVLLLERGVVNVAIPLWLVTHTEAPRSLVGVLFVLNTLVVIALQVRLARGSEDLTVALRAARRAAILLALTCGAAAAAASASVGLAIALLVLAALSHAFAEILIQVASVSMAYGLASDDRPAEYQGVFNLGFAASALVAPPAALAVVAVGSVGWILAACGFGAAGIALVPALGWAVRTRPPREPAPGAA